MKKNLIHCKNCEQKFEQEFRFCPYCGQNSNEDLNLKVLFYNTISNYFSVDARFFKSFIPLIFKPGYLANKFIEGKRLLYLHPAQMYLFISVVFFFLFSIITRKSTEEFDTALKKGFDKTEIVLDSIKNIPELDSINTEKLIKNLSNNKVAIGVDYNELDSILKSKKSKPVINSSFNFDEKRIDSLLSLNASDSEIYKTMGLNPDAGFFKRKIYSQALKFYKQRNGGSILKAFYDSIPIAMFILLPIFALLLKLFYFRKGTFAHHLVFTFYHFSFLFLLFSILIIANLIWKLPLILISLTMLLTCFYLFIAVKHFYKQGYFVSFIKSSMISFLFLCLVIPMAVLIIGITAFLFY